MRNAKPSAPVHDDRPGVSHVSILAHTGLLAGRDTGSPGVPTELGSTRSSISGSCARMNEGALRQLLSEAAPQGTASYEELPRLILGTNDRNPGETQPRASNTNPTIESPTLWRPVFEKWSAYIRERKAAGTHKEYTQKVRATFDWVEATRNRADLRDIMWEDFETY